MDISHLVNGNECLVTYNLTNEYISRTAIAQKGSDDISTALESTFHWKGAKSWILWIE